MKPIIASGYVSSPGMHVFTWRMRPQLAYVSAPGEYVFASNRSACLSNSPSPSWVCAQISCAYHPVFKSIKSLDGDRDMDRCHYAVPFKGISIWSTPEMFFHLNETNNYSSRPKKVPTTYRLFNVVDKKTAGFKRSFISVDVVSA